MTRAPTLVELEAMDALDPIAPFRARFVLPDGVRYLDGNSLGVLPTTTASAVEACMTQQWGRDLVTSWTRHGWIDMSVRLGAAIAPLIGARPSEVLVCDSTSVNLYKLAVAALRFRPGRSIILTETGNFPTDAYILEGVRQTLPGRAVRSVATDAIIDTIDEDVALVVLTHVHYKSAAKQDLAAITEVAHRKGALILWDLSHSAGAVPVDLDSADVDLAVGCGYKYLNGGPGAPAFLFVAERLQHDLQPPLPGWMGHAAPFDFEDRYRPADDIRRFLCGTPPILAMIALEHGIASFDGVDLAVLFRKGQALGAAYIALVEERLAGHGFDLASPPREADRGSHVSFTHADGYAICQALIARGVVGDFRQPDIVRMGFAPLYLRFTDVWHAVDALVAVMQGREWDRPEYQRRAAVT